MEEEVKYTDPHFTDIPWEQFYDDDGNLIGEHFKPLPISDRGKAK
ncbi:hypothetical protein AB6A23_11035 [Paenibacillus tarimensis]